MFQVSLLLNSNSYFKALPRISPVQVREQKQKKQEQEQKKEKIVEGIVEY